MLRLMSDVMTRPAVNERDRGNIGKQQILNLLQHVASEDGSLDGTACGDLVGVDQLVGLLAIDQVGDELGHTGHTGGAADDDDLTDLGPRIFASRRTFSTTLRVEQKRAWQSSSKCAQMREVEVGAVEEGIDVNSDLGGGQEGVHGMLAGGMAAMESTEVVRASCLC